jgi:hypothetical protein
MSSKSDSIQCSAVTRSGLRCRNAAVPGGDLCHIHAGAPVGAPAGNRNAAKHGFYSQPATELHNIDDVVGDLMRRQSQLSAFIESHVATGDVDIESMAKMLGLLGQNASRIGRLLRDQRALSGAAADGLLGALSTALDELGSEWGREL